MMKFSCPRTCPLAQEQWCRFRAILDLVGPVKVDSHTATVVVDYKDWPAFKGALESIGGTWLGMGCHGLADGKVTGFGFALPGWELPLVLGEGGTLSYDDYGGRWGNVADLKRLESAYAREVCRRAAESLGWLVESAESGALTIYHPSGGTLTVSGEGKLDLEGFVGNSCHDALLSLGVPLSDVSPKCTSTEVQATIQATE
jgi:hypothetical protein